MKTKAIILLLTVFGIMAACAPKSAGDKKCGKSDSCAAKDSAACKDSCKKHMNYSKIIAAKIYVKADKIQEFTKIFKVLSDSTLKEPGCTGYQLYQNPAEKTTFLVFETYKNQAAVEAHFAAGYFKEIGAKIGPLTTKASEIVIYDVAGETKK